MGTIRGKEYSSVRTNEFGEREYYIDQYDEWMTKEEVQEQNDEEGYWEEQAGEWEDDEDGTGWAD